MNDDVYKFPGDCNVYLLLDPKPIVIDTSNPSVTSSLASAISKIIPLSDIKAVLLTHLHFDHCSNVGLFPNAEVFVPKKEQEDFVANPHLFFLGDVPKNVFEIVKNATALPDELFGLSVIEVPGHTRGSVALLDEKRKLLFSGDTLFFNGIGRTDFPNSVPEKMNESLNTLKVLIEEKKLQLMPGHDY